jgi:hypothetical protein
MLYNVYRYDVTIKHRSEKNTEIKKEDMIDQNIDWVKGGKHNGKKENFK